MIRITRIGRQVEILFGDNPWDCYRLILGHRWQWNREQFRLLHVFRDAMRSSDWNASGWGFGLQYPLFHPATMQEGR